MGSEMCIRDSRQTLTGKLLRSLMQAHVVEVGTHKNMWELDPAKWQCLFTLSWIKKTWLDAKQLGVTVLPPRSLRKESCDWSDKCIMELFVEQGANGKILKALNWC